MIGLLLHLDLSFIFSQFCRWYEEKVQFHSSAFGYPFDPIPFVEKTTDYVFPIERTWKPCQKLITTSVRIYFWTFISILMPAPHNFAWQWVWNWVLWVLQLCFFSPRLFWPLWVSWISVWILRPVCKCTQGAQPEFL